MYPCLPVGVSGHSLGLDGKVRLNSGIFKEQDCSANWARSDQRHRSLGPMGQVVNGWGKTQQEDSVEKETKVTEAN